MGKKLTKGQLTEWAESRTSAPTEELSYEELRSKIEIHTCRECMKEYLSTQWDGFCSDTCQVIYLDKHH